VRNYCFPAVTASCSILKSMEGLTKEKGGMEEGVMEEGHGRENYGDRRRRRRNTKEAEPIAQAPMTRRHRAAL
jgi:hypothetical protein